MMSDFLISVICGIVIYTGTMARLSEWRGRCSLDIHARLVELYIGCPEPMRWSISRLCRSKDRDCVCVLFALGRSVKWHVQGRRNLDALRTRFVED